MSAVVPPKKQRAVWIDRGNDPDYERLARHGIQAIVFDIRESRLTKAYLLYVRSRGYSVGVYAAWNWWPNLSGAQFAEKVAAKLKPLNFSQDVPFVHLNAETKDTRYIADMLARWRIARARKFTVWTMEGHQTAVYLPIMQEILDSRVAIGPQCYSGDMGTRFESASEIQRWVEAGIPTDLVIPFLDAADLGAFWGPGVAFTQGRLP